METVSPGRIVWRRFKRNRLALGGLVLILAAVLVTLTCYWFIPDSTPDANRICLAVGNRPPGFSVRMLLLRKNATQESAGLLSRLFTGSKDLYDAVPVDSVWLETDKVRYLPYGGGPVQSVSLADAAWSLKDPGSVVVSDGRITAEATDGSRLTATTEELTDRIFSHQLADRSFLLGTDRYGRDMFSRLMAGTRVTFVVGLVAVIISLFIGLLLGGLAGYFRGRVDDAVMWLINVVWAIPTLLLVIAITLVLGKGFMQVFIAVGLTMWVDVARIVRSQLFSVRELEFVAAGRTMGFSDARILFRHMLPNVFGPVLVVAAANFSTAILLEAGLSFLGIGAQPPTPSWGSMIKENYGYIILPESAYLALLPGIAILLLSLAFTFVANGLRDAMDSRQQLLR
ncbi:MAG: hypothetical protein RL021_1597 [Bacteroidota bacterium]|jgi:peptide/nickel transport system permease protein